jgi:hypothetical protein
MMNETATPISGKGRFRYGSEEETEAWILGLMRCDMTLEEAQKLARDNPPVCSDCAVKLGEFHDPGCDMERCPVCLRQRISCGCS